MSRYRMCFFTDGDYRQSPCGPSVGISAVSKETATRMSDLIWADIEPSDPAVGYCLIDTVTNKNLFVRTRADA